MAWARPGVHLFFGVGFLRKWILLVPAAPAVAVQPVAHIVDAAADEDDPAFVSFGDIHAMDKVDAHVHLDDAAWLGVFEPM